MRRTFLLLLLVVGCSSPRPAQRDDPPAAADPVALAPLVPGELVVRTDAPEQLTTEALQAALGRTDLVVEKRECLNRSCRLVLSRLGGPADEAWTRALITAFNERRPVGVVSAEPNALSTPR